jgi:phosphoribosyl 1,2-cyclic phosphate phosphodiesterase
MDLLICGTAAAEGVPALFCHCDVCREARARGGRELRSRAAYMIGERIRIDLGPDTNLHAQRYGLPLERLEHLLITHAHWDHWVVEELAWRRPGFSIVPETATLHVYGNEKVGEALDRMGDHGRFRLAFHEIEAFAPIELGDGVTAVPVPAAHDRSQLCVNYLLDVQGCGVLQGHDTGWWDELTWEYLATQRLDVVLLDSTSGRLDVRSGHLGGPWVVRAKKRLAEAGALAPGGRFFATHFSHNGGWLHTDAEAFYHPHGIEVAYDGLRVPLVPSIMRDA